MDFPINQVFESTDSIYTVYVCFVASVVSECHPIDCTPPGPSSMGLPRQEYLSELPFPPPGDLPNPRIKPASPVALALAEGSFTTETPGKPIFTLAIALSFQCFKKFF